MSPTEDHAYKIAREWLEQNELAIAERVQAFKKQDPESLSERIRTYGREEYVRLQNEMEEKAREGS